jgi:shikimate dehydrogenase
MKKAPPKIYGLIGYPVKHSLSPAMHNAAFKAAEIAAEYKLFEISPQELEDFLLNPDKEIKDTEGNTFHSGDVLGFNVTVPHKVAARQILEKNFPEILEQKLPLSKEEYSTEEDLYYVRLAGAINTVKREGLKLLYRNTDAKGFLKSLTQDLKFLTKDKNVLIMGCGGAGRAVIASLSWINTGIQYIYVYDSSPESVNSARVHFQFPHLRNRLKFIEKNQIPQVIASCQLLVNASPIGMKEGDESVIEKSLLHANLSVYDVVYNRQTQLIKDAQDLGLSAVSGLGMLLYQGVAAWEFWTGRQASVNIMKEALEAAIKE